MKLSICAGLAVIAAVSASWNVERSTGALVDQAEGWSELEGVGLHPGSADFSLDSRGWPEQSDAASSIERRGRKSGSSKVTWYSGRDMANPACFSTWHPSSSRTLVAATGSHWSGRPPCGSFVELRRGSHKVVVRIIDLCDGCSRGKAWLDLSTSAFKRLGMSLGVGEASGIKWRLVKTPHSFSKTRYGPKKVHL